MTTAAAGNRTELPDSSHFRRQAFIDGEFVAAASGETFDCVSPVSGESLFDVAACDAEDVDRAVAAARRSFEAGAWSQLEPKRRKAVLLRLADLIERDKDELALMITLDMGKPIASAAGEVSGAVGCFRYFAEAVDKVYGEVGPTGPSAVTHGHARAARRRRPGGAVELPDPDADVEAGARARDGQLGRAQARRAIADRGAGARERWPPRRACRTAS